jgi:hypothetical protein
MYTVHCRSQEAHEIFLMHCWRILKDKPKWMERRNQIGGTTTASNKKQKTKANSSPSSLVLVVSPATGGVDAAAQDSASRPDGEKEVTQLASRSGVPVWNFYSLHILPDFHMIRSRTV